MKNKWQDVKPFMSILIVIGTLFGMVFLKMEVRRMGYSVLRSTQEIRRLQDQRRLMRMDYARQTRPDHIRKFAVSHLTLGDAHNGQIIQLTGANLAVPQ